MIDYGGQKTDLAIKRAEWRLSRVYNQAAREIDEKTKAWQERHEAKDQKLRQMVKDGKMSKEDYQAWQRGQVFQGKQWQGRKEQIQQVLLNSDKAAMSVIKEGKPGVFAANANYIGYSLEHDSGLNTGFLLYDEQTVARLVKSDPKMLPMLPPEKAINKDKAYTYYNKLINNAITQGIIQGESIGQIAHRIAKNTGEKCYKSAVTNARTAYTGAQNAGRIEGMHQAQRIGIKVQKQWMSTPDNRTRDAHIDLNGQIQNVDDPFVSKLGEIDYPGDPGADPANVYNCRCSLLYVYPEYPSDMTASADDVEDMSMDEWEDMKQEEETTEFVQHVTVDGRDISQTWERRPDEFDFEIDDVINAQGFDGLPKLLDADEFDRAVQESNFIAQRTYSASDQETLDAYRDQLYNGKFYVDCSVNGADRGQGMYCAANYSTDTHGLSQEMQYYIDYNRNTHGNSFSNIETFTLTPDAKIADYRTEFENFQNQKKVYRNDRMSDYIKSEVDKITTDEESRTKLAGLAEYTMGVSKTRYSEWEVMNSNADFNTREFYEKWGNFMSDLYQRDGAGDFEKGFKRIDDFGSYCAIKGYDAINAPGERDVDSYTVILNRTKVIFRRPE